MFTFQVLLQTVYHSIWKQPQVCLRPP